MEKQKTDEEVLQDYIRDEDAYTLSKGDWFVKDMGGKTKLYNDYDLKEPNEYEFFLNNYPYILYNYPGLLVDGIPEDWTLLYNKGLI